MLVVQDETAYVLDDAMRGLLTSVVHTWGSALPHHPHIHMIVPGGRQSPDGAGGLPANGVPSACACAGAAVPAVARLAALP